MFLNEKTIADNMSKKLKVGDIFNESDEDDMIQVTEIRDKQDPPVVLCSTMHDNSDSEETEQEYDVGYVSGAVDLRQKYESYGFAALDVQGIYRLSKKDLIHALSLAKQNTLRPNQLGSHVSVHKNMKNRWRHNPGEPRGDGFTNPGVIIDLATY